MRSVRRRQLSFALALAWEAVTMSAAAAHAIVVASEPAVDAVLRGPQIPVLLRFNSRIDQERSRLTLIRPDASTQAVPLAASTSADTLASTLDGLAAGHYRLRWQVLSVDGHITRGDIPFTIAP